MQETDLSKRRGLAKRKDLSKLNITVVGLGLIGGSLAMALRKLNPRRIWAVEIDQAALQEAERMGIIDGGYPDGTIPLPESDLVMICLHPGQLLEFIRKHRTDFKPGAVLTDSCGLKSKIVSEIKKVLRPDLDFVGGHPLAGREGSGLAQASAEIFQDANYILTPVGARRESVELLESIIVAIGCKPAIHLEAEVHDRVIAFTSHLPHLLAAALMNSCFLSEPNHYAGGSFRDATRVAEMNVDLWSDLFMENRQNVLTQLRIFEDNISSIKHALQNKNESALKALLIQANEARKKF